MKLHILGTGNGGALKCYNTCFALENNNEFLLVDGGGGNQILKQLKLANIDLNNIHNIFLSHIHTDHILGIIWVLRSICSKMKFGGSYTGNLNVFGCKESLDVLQNISEMLFPPIMKFRDRIIFNVVEDRQTIKIMDVDVTFFDIRSEKEKQFAFVVGDKLAFCGDNPLQEELFDFVSNKEWLIHESFCLDSEEGQFHAHDKYHCTVKEAGMIATEVNAKNLIIVHTEDNNIDNRKALYTEEASQVYEGNVYVPYDLEVIDL